MPVPLGTRSCRNSRSLMSPMAHPPSTEEKFAALAEIAPVGIFRTDMGGLCTYANPRWCEIAGLSQTEALGTGWANGLHSEDRERIFATWQQATERGQLFLNDLLQKFLS